jgi:hypothetical protein
MIPMDKKLETTVRELLRFFIKRVPRANRTQLVKFLYLTDLASREFLGRPATALDYIWYNYGPFDSRILAQLSSLAEEKVIKEHRISYPKGDGYQYVTSGVAGAFRLDSDTAAIADFIARRFGQMSLNSLLRRVYRTPPMAEAKARDGKGKRLPMSMVDGSKRELFEGIKTGARQLREGRRIPFSRVLQEAGALA